MQNGFPPVGELSDAELREKVHELAMAVAYTWLLNDHAAQDAFLDEILAVPAGVSLSIDAYTAIRLLGVQAGMLRDGVKVAPRWQAPADRMDRDGGNYEENVAVITDLWTGRATGNHGLAARAEAELHEMRPPQVRDVLRIMAFDTGHVMEIIVSSKSLGAECLERYREAVAIADPARLVMPEQFREG